MKEAASQQYVVLINQEVPLAIVCNCGIAYCENAMGILQWVESVN